MAFFYMFSPLERCLVAVTTVGVGVLTYNFNKINKKSDFSSNIELKPSTKWNNNWDLSARKNALDAREFETERSSKCKPTATKHIVLIRHGEYYSNDDGKRLTDIGRNQAELTGNRLKELNLPFTDIIRSTMTRAQETGAIISKILPEIPVKDCSLLKEGTPFPPEPPRKLWKDKYEEQHNRIENAFQKYFYRASVSQVNDTFTILVCHANVIRYFVCRALQLPPEAWSRFALNHGSITWIMIEPDGRVLLRNLGDSGHIPPQLITQKSQKLV